MKDYKRSDYAANKKSKNIVYKSEVSNDVDITLEKFLASDPTLTEADFEYWKNWSDDKYKKDELKERRERRKDVSIEDMKDVLSFAEINMEEEYETESLEKVMNQAIHMAIDMFLNDAKISFVMKERFKMYYLKGLKPSEIAIKTKTNRTSIYDSLNPAIKKFTDYFWMCMDEIGGNTA